jgi:hypothetical protein
MWFLAVLVAMLAVIAVGFIYTRKSRAVLLGTFEIHDRRGWFVEEDICKVEFCFRGRIGKAVDAIFTAQNGAQFLVPLDDWFCPSDAVSHGGSRPLWGRDFIWISNDTVTIMGAGDFARCQRVEVPDDAI